MNTDNRSELEQQFDELYSDAQKMDSPLINLIRTLKKERDAWKSTAEACEKDRKEVGEYLVKTQMELNRKIYDSAEGMKK